jgi:hypothetical protein
MLQAGLNVKVTATAFNFKDPDGNITSNSEEAAKVMGDYQASVFSKQVTFDPAAVDGGKTATTTTRTGQAAFLRRVLERCARAEQQ